MQFEDGHSTGLPTFPKAGTSPGPSLLVHVVLSMTPSYSKENLCAEICALNFANGKDVGWALVRLGSIAVAPASCPLRRVRVAVDGCFSYLRHETQIESPIWLHLYRKHTTILENCWIWDGFWGRLAHKTKVLGVVS